MIGSDLKKDVLESSGNMILEKSSGGYERASAFYNHPLPEKGKFLIKVIKSREQVHLGFCDRCDVFESNN